jgi:hypothetical protein
MKTLPKMDIGDDLNAQIIESTKISELCKADGGGLPKRRLQSLRGCALLEQIDTNYYNNALNLAYPTLILQPGDPGTYGIAATARF